MRTSGAPQTINRHLKREAVVMAILLAAPVVLALVGALVVPLLLEWLR